MPAPYSRVLSTVSLKECKSLISGSLDYTCIAMTVHSA
jgi:hypothetical protein